MTVAIEVKERPILFSGEMVRAILEGRKTQTRRVAKFVAYREGLNLQASSLTLEITQVRIERVQDISHADATAEGCRPYCVAFDKLPAQEYRELWDKINAKRGFGWDVNPWVWVIEFRLTNSK
jgi:hypothetical protein